MKRMKRVRRTRMHSSSMRTACSLTVSQHALIGVPAGECTCLGGVFLAGGVPALGGVPGQGVYLPGGVPARGCTYPGGVPAPGVVYLPRGYLPWGVYLPRGYLPRYSPPPCEQNERQVQKISPCPKLRLRAVIKISTPQISE